MKKLLYSIVICLFLVPVDLSALLIGSDLAVSLESFASFPEIYGINPNEIASFAWMKNGFSLENSATELLFRSIYPVSGTVDFNGGTVTLGTDLIFQNVTTLNGLGVIIGDGHQLHFSSSIHTMPLDTHSFENTHIFLDGNIVWNADVTFIGECSILGGNNLLMLGNNGVIHVKKDAIVHLKDINVMGISGEKINCADDSSLLMLENVGLNFDGFFTFTTGAIAFKDFVEFLGTGTFFYDSPMTSTILMDTTWKLSDGLTLKMGRDPFTLADPIYFTDPTSVLLLDNVDYLATASGIQLTRGTIVFDRSVNLDTVSTGTERGMILGDGNPDHDINVRLSPGCSVIHNSGYWTYNNGNPDRIVSKSQTARLIRNEGSLVAVQKSLSFPQQTLEIASSLVSPVAVSAGAVLSYDRTRIVLPTIEFELTGDQLNAFTYELNGNDEMFFSKGTIPLATVVSGIGNVIKGNGAITGPITLSDSAAVLGIDLRGELRSVVTLNNGELSLLGPLALNGSGIINGPGTVHLCTQEIKLNPLIRSWTTPIFWDALEDGVTLQASLDLSETWTIAGEFLLEGNGNILRLQDNGRFFLLSDAHLIMKDIVIQGISDGAIICQDDTCRITFLRANWLLDGDLTVTHGSIVFERSNVISGPYTLSFDQVLTNTIRKNSECQLDFGITFSVGRTDGGREPLYFEDDSSRLHFESASLGVKNTGMTLSRGTMIIDKQCAIDFNSTSTANGLQLGTGVSTEDFILKLNPAATLSLGFGHILENIIDIEKGFIGLSTSAKLSFPPGFVIHYAQDSKLANLTLQLTGAASVSFNPGVDVYLEKVLVAIPVGSFLVTARRFNPLILALEGAPDNVELINGTYPQPLVISGTGNILNGSGVMAGLITYLSPLADLTYANLGPLSALISLNGGTLILDADLRIVGSGGVNGPGTIDLNGKTAFYGITTIVQSTPMTFMGNGAIKFNSKATLQASIHFKDYTTIEGFNNILNISTGELVVDSGATLVLKDLVIQDLANNKIRCVDDTGVVIFDNAQIILDDTFTFTHGAMQFLNKNIIQGAHSFVYQTQMTSTVRHESYLKLDLGVTFSYDPPFVEGNNRLLQFEDSSSLLILNRASFIATSSGIELTKGTLDVKQNSYISSTQNLVSGTERGVAFGDGVDDFNVIVRPEVSLILNSGVLEYRNTSSASLNLTNPLSAIAIGTGATLQLYENIPTGAGRVVFENAARLLRTNATNVIGTIEPRGALIRGIFTP